MRTIKGESYAREGPMRQHIDTTDRQIMAYKVRAVQEGRATHDMKYHQGKHWSVIEGHKLTFIVNYS